MLTYVLLSVFLVICASQKSLQTPERGGEYPCPAGFVVNPNPYATDEICVKCIPGTFSNEQNARQCTACPLNQFAAIAGARECMWCPPLTHAPETGQSECIECLPEDIVPMNSYCFIAAY
jgi:hypothetical protein